MIHFLFRALVRPSRLGDAPPGAGWLALAILGVSWAGLMALLARGGHAPSMTRGLPVPAEGYYATAALYVGPLCLALGGLFARVTGRIVGADPATRPALQTVYGAVLCASVVWPDLVAYALGGFAALGPLVRVTGPLTVAWLSHHTWRYLRAHTDASRGRITLATLAGGLAQAVPAALLIR